MDKTLELIVIALLGALCSILANKGIAVFNDGLRPKTVFMPKPT